MRLRIDLSYDGADFHGWAMQPGLRTVEAELATALTTVLRLPSVTLVCAGRTDTGVHARGQVAHVDVDEDVLRAARGRDAGPPTVALARRLNSLLRADLRVRRVVAAADGFDARFSPRWRRYAYRICDGVTDPLERGHVLTWPRRLDHDAMNEASATLLGLHDFAAFCKRREGATTVRTLLDLHWRRDDDQLTGTIRAAAWAADVLAGRRRDPAVKVLAAHGLTLEEVAYPADEEVRARADQTRARREAR